MTFRPFDLEPSLFQRVVAGARPVTLEELTAEAELMTRVDRKYFVPLDVLGELLSRYSGLRVLQIGEERTHAYESLYFDTPGALFFRQHAQGRRRRYKVRIRTYADGEAFLEVKAKSGRGDTVKNRVPLRELPDRPAVRAYIEEQIPTHPNIARHLIPVVETHYDRVTFLHGGDRVTCDLDLRFHGRGRWGLPGPAEVLVETKSAMGRSPVDQDLSALGIRPVSVSKYGVAMSLLYPELPSNRWHRVLQRYFRGARGPGELNVQNLFSRNDTGVTTPIMMS